MKIEFNAVHKRVILSVSSLLVLALAVAYAHYQLPQAIQTPSYQFTCPGFLQTQSFQSNGHYETILLNKDQCVGGVNHYIYSSTHLLQELLEQPDIDMESVLSDMGILQAGETLDAYMMESGFQNGPIFEVWEMRGEAEHYHFIFTTNDGSLYDLWFDSREVEDSVMHTIKDTFHVEESLCEKWLGV